MIQAVALILCRFDELGIQALLRLFQLKDCLKAKGV